MLSRKEMEEILAASSRAWDLHDLDGILRFMDEDVVFENWTGARVRGKDNLRRAWTPWFENHQGFHFRNEDTFIDESTQKVLAQWELTWPSQEKGYEGKPEIRRGVDVYHFKDGKIIHKFTFCKTTVEIGGQRVKLAAGKP